MFLFWSSILNILEARCLDYKPSKNIFWGDLHVHTAHSLDASLQGIVTDHQEAYDFAKGLSVALGEEKLPVQLSRPLDFVAITDHAEFLGETEICTNHRIRGYNSLTCRFYRNHPKTAFILFNAKLSQIPKDNTSKLRRIHLCNQKGIDCLGVAEDVWQRQVELAQANNSACSFTTFSAYEWSASPRTQNLHRNIIFRDKAVPKTPFSYFDSPTPSQLWNDLDQACVGECAYITIPHNSNLSSGKMFLPYREAKSSKDKHELLQYAERRASHEPLVEIFQHKGSSECYPTQADELCSFEYLPFNNLIADRYDGFLTDTPSSNDFLRSVLKEGLMYEREEGVNPYQFGFVASTDTHLGTPGMVEEQQFVGHGGAGSSAKEQGEIVDSPYFNGGGLTAVWAEENTRESIFSAFERREVYGTSGPRIVLRFFATTEKLEGDCGSEQWLESAYQSGVPMGGEIENNGKLHFYILAEQDPLSAPLELVQIIKGWIEDDGSREKMDSLKLNQAQSSYCLHWQDPSERAGAAFYYVRALEKESPRWSQKICMESKCPEEIPEMIRERAWSSPIWVTNR